MTYGCYNRQPLHDLLLVQDGWLMDTDETGTIRTPIYRVISHTMSTDCKYHLEHDDPKCSGCIHNTRVNP